MSKTFKKILTFAFLSGLGYLGYKIFRLIKDAIELEKFLPKFFESHVGEKPEINLTITFSKILLTAKFSKEALENNPELERSILDYVNNYYSSFCMDKFKVVLQEKVEETVVEEVKTEKPSEEVAKEPESSKKENIKVVKKPKKETVKEEKVEEVKASPKKLVRKPRKKKTE